MRQKVVIAVFNLSAQASGMQPKTEEFLNFLLWSADMLARPTFRNLTDSYESWAYRNGRMRQAASLERQLLLERDVSSPEDRLYRLTEHGRKHVLGGRDPEERWKRLWDDATRKGLLRWAAAERETWLEAVTKDPLLPERLLPTDYLGRQAWRLRVEVLRDAGQQLRTFGHA
jgi:hypothetical protein